MKKFLELIKMPLIIVSIASILYIVDALLAPVLVEGASFMWVTFVTWTIFFGVSLKDRIKAFIGLIIGFLAAVVMMLITSSFEANVFTISISCLIGVFVVNAIVMFFDKAEKFCLNSISGIFTGIFLTFSNLGCGLNPLNGVGDAFLMLDIILMYGVFGLGCGYFSIFFNKKEAKANLEEDSQVKEDSNNNNNKKDA